MWKVKVACWAGTWYTPVKTSVLGGMDMEAVERRRAIAQRLAQADGPVSAAALAKAFSVSRQIIVGDVALLRAGGMEIFATPRGYILPGEPAALTRTVACVHSGGEMARELEIMVDQGCQVVDVVVEHPIYGQLAGQLHLSSRYDVQEFIRSVSKNQANLLSDLTGGIHLHTLRCPSEEAFQRVRAALDEAGLLWKG